MKGNFADNQKDMLKCEKTYKCEQKPLERKTELELRRQTKVGN